MSTNARQSERSTAVRPTYVPLGVDERGAHHCYDTQTETIHIVHPDGSRGRRLLDGGDVDDWMDAVEGGWGWEYRQYGLDLVEMLTRQMEGQL